MFMMGYFGYEFLQPLGAEVLMLDFVCAIGMLVTFFYGLPLFLSEYYMDSDLVKLLPLPFTPVEIVGAKGFCCLLNEYYLVVLMLFPFLLGYGISAKMGVLYWICVALACLIYPVVPLVYAAVLTMIVMRLFKNIRNKDFLSYLGFAASMILLSGILLIPSAAALFGGSGGGRGTAEGGITGLFTDPKMWKPQFLILRLCYTPYGIGLSAFAAAALFGRVLGKVKFREKLLSLFLLVIFCIPLFGYLLNGGLYSKDKVFIPFLPSLCAEVGFYVENQLARKRECGKNRTAGNFKRNAMAELRELLPYLIILVLMWNAKYETYFDQYWHLGMLDVICVMVCYLVWRWIPAKKLLRGRELPFLPLVFSAVILVFAGKAINQEKNVMIPRETYASLTDSKIAEAIREIRAEDPGWYRIEQYGDGGQNLANVNRIWDIGQNISTIYSSAYNAEYKNFRDETYGINEAFRNRMMQTVSDDPLFWRLMGVKYILSETQPEGYELYRDYGTFQVYRAASAAPIAYVTDQVVSESEYESLNYPQNQELLETTAVIPNREWTAGHAENDGDEAETEDNTLKSLFCSRFQETSLEIQETDQEGLRIQKTADGYEIETKKSVTVSATLPDTAEGATLLAVSFHVENQKAGRDMFIRINGQTNRLTGINHTYANGNTEFNYLVTMNEDGTASLRLGKGHYVLKNLGVWTGTAQPSEKTERLYSQAVTLIGGTTATYGGDGITGVVSAERDGYLITSIPYDENFVLKVDGRKTPLFRANTAFLGAKISSGEHQIVLEYHAPGRTAGGWCSVIGILLALAVVICEKSLQKEKQIHYNKTVRTFDRYRAKKVKKE